MSHRLAISAFALTFVAALLLAVAAPLAPAQAAYVDGSCTVVGVGETVNINVHSDCKRVGFSGFGGVGGVCAVSQTTAAEWQSFYNNPPAGVTISACTGSCGGYSYGGYCYYWSGDGVANTCDGTCSIGGRGGCNAAGTRYIGSDDSSGSRCGAVGTMIAGTPVTASAGTGTDTGCSMNTVKGGYIPIDSYSPTTTCSGGGGVNGRICACVN